MRKKIYEFTALACMISLILCGCSGRTISFHEEDTAAGITADHCPGVDGKIIGICITDGDDAYMTAYAEELREYLEAGGATVKISNGRNDQEEQTNQIINLLNAGVDAIIVSLILPSSVDQITDLCSAAAVPVVYINREPDSTEEARWESEDIMAAYVGPDALSGGQIQGKIVLDSEKDGDLNGDGVISYGILAGETDAKETTLLCAYPVQTIIDAGGETEKLFEIDDLSDMDDVKDKAAEELTECAGKADVIFCTDDMISLGAAKFLENAGIIVGQDVLLIGANGTQEAFECIEDGTMTGTVFNDFFSQSREAGRLISRLLDGDENGTVSVYDYLEVTADNVSSVSSLFEH